MDPSVQILKPWLKVRFVILPRHAIHAGRGFALERVVRRPERVDVEVVEERSELFLLPLPCGFPYARSSAWATRARLCVRCVFCWSAFPLVPSLGSTNSATGTPALFVGFVATMPESDFSGSCISGYGSSPSRHGPSAQ